MKELIKTLKDETYGPPFVIEIFLAFVLVCIDGFIATVITIPGLKYSLLGIGVLGGALLLYFAYQIHNYRKSRDLRNES